MHSAQVPGHAGPEYSMTSLPAANGQVYGQYAHLAAQQQQAQPQPSGMAAPFPQMGAQAYGYTHLQHPAPQVRCTTLWHCLGCPHHMPAGHRLQPWLQAPFIETWHQCWVQHVTASREGALPAMTGREAEKLVCCFLQQMSPGAQHSHAPYQAAYPGLSYAGQPGQLNSAAAPVAAQQPLGGQYYGGYYS